MVGTSVSTVVLPLVVYQTTGSAAQTGVLFAMRVVPYLALGLIAGPVADRGDRRKLIIGGNLAEGALVATIPLAHALGVLTIGQIYVVALLAATAFVFSDAAVFGAVPALVGPARLPAANGFLSAMSSGAEIVGPVIGGVLVATIGAANAVYLDAASFFVAAAVQAGIRSDFRTPSAGDSDGAVGTPPSDRIRAQIRRALSFIRHHRTVATLLVVGFGNSFAFGAVLGLLVPYAVQTLGLDSDDGRIGILYGAVGVGSLVSGLVFSRLFAPGRIRLLTPGTILCSGLLAGVLATTALWPGALLIVGVFAWSIGTTIMVGITYRQLVAPDDLRSSVNVIGRMISWGGQPFGAATGAFVAASASVSAAYAMASVVMLVSAIAAAVLLRRTETTATAATTVS